MCSFTFNQSVLNQVTEGWSQSDSKEIYLQTVDNYNEQILKEI